MLDLDELQNRRDELSNCLVTLDTDLKIHKDKAKVLKQEISNAKGALVEIDRMIELWD